MMAFFVLTILSLIASNFAFAFVIPRPVVYSPIVSRSRCGTSFQQLRAQESKGSILVLDHLNINHQAGRHDLLKAFYFDVLGCSCDPRKVDNLQSGKKTLWANAGINQFHLPEADTAQVLDGSIVLSYPDITKVRSRLESGSVPDVLKGTAFSWQQSPDGSLTIKCPWGNNFEVRAAPSGHERDTRGTQPGEQSEPGGMPEIVIHVAHDADLAGIARFYDQLMGASVVATADHVVVACGPLQRLVFRRQQHGVPVSHSDYHVSMYIQPKEFQNLFNLVNRELTAFTRRMEAAGLVFVNPRFKRQARTLEEAVDQCMFRVRDIVDPANPAHGPILQLEHEIRSPVKADGSPYKSCPLRLA